MPITPLIIDDELLTGTINAAPTYSPRDFHKDITGNGTGTTRGRINGLTHPANPDLSYDPIPLIDAPTKDQIDGETTVRTLVIQPLLERHLIQSLITTYESDLKRYRADRSAATAPTRPYFYQFDVPVTQRIIEEKKGKKITTLIRPYMFDLTANMTNAPEGFRLWLNLEPQLVVLRDRGVMDATTGKNEWTKTTHIRYRIELFAINNDEHSTPLLDEHGDPMTDDDGNTLTAPDPERVAAVTNIGSVDPLSVDGVDSFVLIDYSFNVPETIDEMIDQLSVYLRGGRGGARAEIDQDAFFEFSSEHYKIYDRITAQAEVFATDAIAPVIIDYIGQNYAVAFDQGVRTSTRPNHDTLRGAATELSFLDNFPVPLSAYTALYNALIMLDTGGDTSHWLIKHNMQLKQNAELQALAAIKDQLPNPGTIDATAYSVPDRMSIQQRAAVETTDPLVMVVAGAGSGKTTVITERIRMLTQGCHVDPSTILALSFTNAAADEIRSRPGNEGIVSKTIALMIHEIYGTEFPTHQLSTMETILNSLDIYYGTRMQTDDVLAEFAKRIKDMADQGKNSAIIAMSAFIEAHTDIVVAVLNTIRQTTLELEIILCYLLIDKMAEPYESPEYLIIDEVQDNSAFQFVYAMRYAIKHKCALYLVGDASQTLYEFRAANPKALAALEASGVFEVCKLSTNYRSTQEILDFANVHLLDIEANRFTGIQLQSNALTGSTPESFSKTVNLVDHSCGTQRAFLENLKSYLTDGQVQEYIAKSLADGQTLAILCETRRHVKIAEEALKKMFPDEPVHNLVSDRAYSATTFSAFVARFWHEVTAVPPSAAAFTFSSQIKNHLSALERNNLEIAEKRLLEDINAWWLKTANEYEMWVSSFDAGLMPAEEVYARLQQSILNYEIENNAIRSSLLNRRNALRKEEMAKLNPKLLVSTVHGVKGMEFDNTIVVLQPEALGPRKKEDYKRLLYVALTRAKRSEMILAGTGSTKARITTDYNLVLEALEKRQAEQEEEASAAAAEQALIAATSGDDQGDSDAVTERDDSVALTTDDDDDLTDDADDTDDSAQRSV